MEPGVQVGIPIRGREECAESECHKSGPVNK